MNFFQHLRLLVYRGSLVSGPMFSAMMTRLPGMTCTRVKNLKLIGEKELVDQALEVLADFEFASPELCAELDAKGAITFLYVPQLQSDSSLGKYFFVGKPSIAWGKTGLLAHMVWTALKLRADLQNPSTSFRDAYAGEKIMRGVLSDMSDWLTTHHQPAELIENLSALRAGYDAQQTKR